MNRVRDGLIDVCIVVTITFALLVLMELAAQLLSSIRRNYFPDSIATVLKQAWGRQYAEDERRLKWRHVDYVEFREMPLNSATITVDGWGRRRVPGNCEEKAAFTIWMFGGSTMFGYGSPDEFTIPAHLTRKLNLQGRCTTIVNYGSGSWQSTQSTIQLIEGLKRIRRPDAVIFYDGINDIANVDLGGTPGGLDPNTHVRLDRAFGQSGLLESIARSSVLVRNLSSLAIFDSWKPRENARPSKLSDISGAARATAAIYAQNVRVVDVLAKEYGFSAYYFLQPYPFISGKKLTATERAIVLEPTENLNEDLNLARIFYRAFREGLALKSHPGFFDISDVFDGLTEELFADDAHLLPEGNRIVAERIAREIFPPSLTK